MSTRTRGSRLRFKIFVAALSFVLAAPLVSAALWPRQSSLPVDPCAAPGPTSDLPTNRDLYCLHLTASPGLEGVTGTVGFRRIPGPFTATAEADGLLSFSAVAELGGLPDPSSLGEYSAYVAWIAPPTLFPIRRLGVVTNGRTELGDIASNRFLVLISAEASPEASSPSGRFVLRGQSPSSRLRPADFIEFALGAAPADETGHEHTPAVDVPHDVDSDAGPTEWTTVPMPEGVTMLPAMMMLRPDVGAFLPTEQKVRESGAGEYPIRDARPREVIRLADGDSLALEALLVRRTIRGRSYLMYGFNGQVPGPLLWVPQDATVTIDFTNRIDWPTSVHWHGLRLDNEFDGVPGVTQEPVYPGETFRYRVRFPDAGIYWYHPHHREEVQQDLGLYGNMLVRSSLPDYYGPVNREEVLMLDDLLIGDDGLVPFGLEGATHLLSGRFGNLMLVNGEPDFRLEAVPGEVIRLFLTNVSNTRTFNVSFGGIPIKVVGSDVGNFERETWAPSVVIAPAERYTIHVRFPEEGTFPILNRVQSIDHINGRFFAETDTLGTIDVSGPAADPDLSEAFVDLREPAYVAEDLARYRQYFDRPVDRRLVLEMRARDYPLIVDRLMQLDSAWFSPVEWTGTMPMMNWMSTASHVDWILTDPDSGLENLDIDWRFDVGDVVKIRLHNSRESIHAMHHPIHLHGQRFLLLAQDGVPNDNLAWKDTALIPVGSTIDILLDVSNPGAWMLHCHIAEHLEAGMKMVFRVGSRGH